MMIFFSAISASWCVSYDDPTTGAHRMLPRGTWGSWAAAMVSTTMAFFFRVKSVRRLYKPLSNLQDWKKTLALSTLILSNLAMMSCAFIPMSCGDLHDGVEWIYVSWRDHVHDASLMAIFGSTIVSGFAAGYWCHRTKRVLLVLTVLFAVLQSRGIDRCPTSSDMERVSLIVFEVLAIAIAQFLHYGTVNHLVSHSSFDRHGAGQLPLPMHV